MTIVCKVKVMGGRSDLDRGQFFLVEVLLLLLLSTVHCLMQVGDDNYEVVPGSQFVVSRTAFKDNSSSYKVAYCFLTVPKATVTSCSHRRQRCNCFY